MLPSDDRLRWILAKSAAVHGGGAEPVSGLVLPTSEFFPDVFDGTMDAVKRLLRRVVRLAGLSDVPVRLRIHQPEEQLGGGGCSTGACAVPKGGAKIERVVPNGDGYDVTIQPHEVSNPIVLTSAMVRAVSHIFLREADLYQPFARGEAELGVDLAGVFLGFGALLANASYIYKKG
jgi:hypothetical protein